MVAAGGARVADLAERLDVTEETIRRDLRRLDSDGRLVRTHGGAVPVDGEAARDLPLHHRRGQAVLEKRAIAAAAAATVEAGQTIALDASSTALELARALPDVELTVVTPSPLICMELAGRPRLRVVCIGGVLDDDAVAFTGPLAEATLGRLHVDRCYFSCRGIDLRRGMTEATDRHAALKAAMLEAADRATLMADASKFATASTVYFGTLADVHAVIVDAALAEATCDAIRERGLDLTLVSVGPGASLSSSPLDAETAA